MFYGNRFDGPGFRPGAMLLLLLCAVIVVASAALLAQMLLRSRRGMHPFPPAARPPWQHQPPSPMQILDERFARGEIGVDEYRERRATLSEPR